MEIDTSSLVVTMNLGTPLDFVEYEMSEEEFEFFLRSIEQYIHEREGRGIKRKTPKTFFRRILRRE